MRGATVTSETPTQGRHERGDTPERIRSVALELFADQGYDATSLREIADRLNVTKAALYYHFKTKEDIISSALEDYCADLDALSEWGEGQPRDRETRLEIVDRLTAMVDRWAEPMRVVHQNPTLHRHLVVDMRSRFDRLRKLLHRPDAPLPDQLRAMLCIAALGISKSLFSGKGIMAGEFSNEEVNEASRTVARELIDRQA